MMIRAINTKGEHLHTWYFDKYSSKIQKLIHDVWSKHENWYVCKRGCAHDGFDRECECKCHYYNNEKLMKKFQKTKTQNGSTKA